MVYWKVLLTKTLCLKVSLSKHWKFIGWIFLNLFPANNQKVSADLVGPDMRRFMREEGFGKIYVFIRCISCGQITNPTGKFPIKVIKQKWKGGWGLTFSNQLPQNIKNIFLVFTADTKHYYQTRGSYVTSNIYKTDK